jgi:Copper amine oxidase N-terminal domain.
MCLTIKSIYRIIVVSIVAILINVSLIPVSVNEDHNKSSLTEIKIKINSNILEINNYIIYIDSNKLVRVELYQKKGEILVPLRAVAEALNYTVKWNELRKEIILENSGSDMTIRTHNKFPLIKTYHEGKSYVGYLDMYLIMIMHDRTYVSVDFIRDILNCDVTWCEDDSTILITSKRELINASVYDTKLSKDGVNKLNAYKFNQKNTKNKILDAMRKALNEDKSSQVHVNFNDILIEKIFQENINNYFAEFVIIRKSLITNSLLVEFKTIQEAEEMIQRLNCWDGVNYAEMNYKVHLIN